MKVSIVMAAYNAESYIEESIESILNQTFKDWELIVCDDNSNDNTYEILSHLALKDNRIKLFRNNENKKAGFSRNLCISNSTGEYIAIQDADDISTADRLEKQVSFLEKHKDVDFVGTGAYILDENNERKEVIMKKMPSKKDFLISFPFIHASIMFKRQVLIGVKGYRVSKETIRGQDSDMIMRIYEKGFVGMNLNMPLYVYRQGKEGEKRRSLKRRFDAVKIRYKRFKGLGLFPGAIPFIFVPLFGTMFPREIKNKIKNIIKK